MGTKKRTSKQGKYLAVQAEKKSGHPTQPGNRSTAPQHTKKRKRRSILYHVMRKCKTRPWEVFAVLAIAIVAVIVIVSCVRDREIAKVTEMTEPQVAATEAVEPAPVEPVFTNQDGTPVDLQDMAALWSAVANIEKRYDLTDAERWEVASVVTAEAAGEPFAGKVAVAQCILQACEDDGIRPDEALVKYAYAPTRPEPTEEALEAVQAVFDFGQIATTEPIKYFYAPARVESEWHESQDYVMTINGHKFFKEAE